jgi:hypothetical protein
MNANTLNVINQIKTKIDAIYNNPKQVNKAYSSIIKLLPEVQMKTGLKDEDMLILLNYNEKKSNEYQVTNLISSFN